MTCRTVLVCLGVGFSMQEIDTGGDSKKDQQKKYIK